MSVMLRKLHVLTTGRLYLATFLSTSTFLYVCIGCCQANSKGAELEVFWMHVPACRMDVQCLYDPLFDECRHKNQSVLEKALKWALCPRFSCSYQVSGLQYIHKSRLKKKLFRRVLLFFSPSPNLGKTRELKLHRWSAFLLLSQSVVEQI